MSTIAFIEDEELIRESVTAILEAKTQHSVIYSCGSVEEFIKTFSTDKIPDILLLDIGLPGLSGISGIPTFLDLIPKLDIIMFSTYEENDKIYEALHAGACSYVSKRSSPAKVIDAINVVAMGGAYMSPNIARKITDYFSKLNRKEAVELSARQKEIISYVVKGLSYPEIAKNLFISHNTVKTHVKRIYELLRINSKTDLLKKYYDGELG